MFSAFQPHCPGHLCRTTVMDAYLCHGASLCSCIQGAQQKRVRGSEMYQVIVQVVRCTKQTESLHRTEHELRDLGQTVLC